MSARDRHAQEYAEAGPLRGGFVLHRLSEQWASLVHDPCGKAVMFVRATRQRVDWFAKSHVCGPLGTGWPEASMTGGPTPQETSALMRYLAWLVSNTTPNVLASPPCQSAAREAIDVLQAGLAAAGLTKAGIP